MGKSNKEGKKNDDILKKTDWSLKEEEILKFWNENRIFEKSLEKNKGAKSFVFFDGPPFATGLPHYGSILPSTIKDVIPRYRTMKGDYVRRVWGWDCHGLPIENLIEKELGLENKKDIEELGVGKFNSAAKASVLRYDKEWKKIIPRIGRWIDMDNGYKTMDASYTESVWWGFKELYKKGLVYKDRKSMHVCPRCETTLSNTEVALGYKDITDISVTVKFELESEQNTFILAWTTTPWTLPGNVALAVGKDIDYVKVEIKDDKKIEKFIVAKYRLKEVFKDKEIEILEEMKGIVLEGKKYKPVFDYYSKDEKLMNRENGWKVYSGDFVTTESGTGIVHIAPAFGEDDMKMGKDNNLPFIQHVSFDGKLKTEVEDFAGQYVKPKDYNQKTDIEIIKYLAHKEPSSLLFSKEKIIHSYPHCWRCDTPLLNYATSSWFIKVTAIKDRLVELNKNINWVPKSIGEGRFGNWLENARDWSISRARFWGAAIPVWECEKCEEREVIGSVEDVKKNIKSSANTYTIMRHGQADSNVEGVLSGKKDNPHHLTAKGEKEVVESSKEMKSKKIDIIISSPFVRTTETAKIVAKEIGFNVEDIIYDERLSEIKSGEFEGRSIDDYHEFFGSLEGMFTKRPQSGENVQDVKERVMGFLYDIDAKYTSKNILIVTHASPIWMLLAGARGDTKKQTVGLWRNIPEGSVKTAEVVELDFIPLPHNSEYELDLHKPYIDDIVFECKCGGQMKRVSEVFDCWVESGSMPFAQLHYPFENKKEFENNFPADFIAEGIDQTRGWFYNMLVLSVGIFDKAPYENVIVNGMMLAEDGKKMSKKLKNYPEPWDVLNKYSADALRMYMLGSPVVHAEDLRFSESGVDEVQKKVIGRVLNVLSFYKLYSGDGNTEDIKSDNVLDKWIISRLYTMGKQIEDTLDKYEIDRAIRPIGIFVDDLSTWFLRRSRTRFKGEDIQDKKIAIATTQIVMIQFAKFIAPFMPFTSEYIYKELGGKKESVHLEDWPEIGITDEEVLDEMEEVRRVVSLGLEARAIAGIKIRQPLAQMKIKNEKIKDKLGLIRLILDEMNVKEVVFDNTIMEEVELDINITKELKKEGEFREFLRHVQDVRKKQKLSPGDFVILYISTSDKGKSFVKEFLDELKSSLLAEEVKFLKDMKSDTEIKIGEMVFWLEVVKV